ncbi:hypothetical protein Nmel_006764 [Mimus melanotis]
MENNSPKESSHNPYYIFVIFKGISAQSSRIYRQLSPECPLGIWKRAFGSHMEEHETVAD